ncbi:MAG: D-alanine--D-alanine ligase [Alphaproteobacteria bacterium]|nr:D-alanine--D-alanine ligase [Alphaproteobacteria bacterium]
MSAAVPLAADAARAELVWLAPPRPRVQSSFEFWPRWLFYFPFIVQWTLLAIRYRSLSLPTLANLEFEAGGMCGESKTGLLASFGPACRERLAPFVTIEAPAGAVADEFAAAYCIAAMRNAGLRFPVVAKPDIGCQGTGVRLLHNRAELARYAAAFPRGERFILQRWVREEGEAGIFYVRRPGSPRGSIFSVTLKYLPSVTGDGRSTVEELIRADPRARRIAHIYLSRLGEERRRVLSSGDVLRLVFTGNHCKGAVFRDGCRYVTPRLEAEVERVARSIAGFHFGRFDVRFASLAALMDGKFTILEVNGAGSEATHIWDPATGLLQAYRTLFAQYRLLFEIAAANRARGLRPTPWRDLFRLYRRQQRLMAAYPQEL